ncbi:hypothetical protein GCM10028827_43040 [Mucilaginibacter myungsuensis]
MALLCCLIAAVSCKKNELDEYVEPAYDNPITDYEVVPDPNDAFTFTFRNKTTNYGKLEWRFGDDTLKTDTAPTHTYLATGKYTVDLKAFSKTTDQFSRKLVDINIVPDSVVHVTTTRVESGSGAATIQFNLDVKAQIDSVEWVFDDAATGTTPATRTRSKELHPIKTYSTGTFNSFTVTITTKKGSVVSLNRNVTTEGIAEDITQKRLGYTTVLENNNDPANATANEGSSKLVDGNVDTKFGIYGNGQLNTWAFTIQYNSQVLVKLYAIGNGNDAGNDRDPKEWILEGSDDGMTWTQIDHQVNGTGFFDKANAAGATTDAERYKRLWYYPVTDPKPYSLFRLRFPNGTFNNNDFQLGEFRLYR